MAATDDWRSLYPFESHYVRLDGHRYHYLDEGQGPALLLVHGNPTWSFYWRDLVAALRGRYRVIVPDHLGCGLSDKPQQYDYCLSCHIDNLGRLVESLGLEKITLVAHDWGGAIGLGAAVAAPRRFARFVLMNTAAFHAPRIPARIRLARVPILGSTAVRGMNLFVRAALRMTVSRPERMTPAVRAGYMAPYDSWANRIAVHRFVLDIPLDCRHPSYEPLSRVEAGLALFRHHPTMLIWGMQDWCFTPWFLDRFLEFFPEAEVHRLADAGHYVVEDAHERIVPLVGRFLEKYPT